MITNLQKIFQNKKSIFIALSFAWIFIITISYYYYHPNFAIQALTTVISIATLSLVYKKISTFANSSKGEIKLRVIHIILIIPLATFFLVFLVSIIGHIIPLREISIKQFLATYGKTYLLLFAFLLLCSALGQNLLNIIKARFKEKTAAYLIATAFGISLLIILIFTIGILGLLYKESLIFLFIILLIINIRKIWKTVFWLYQKTIDLKFTTHGLLLAFIITTVISLSFLDSITPLPLDYDSFASYLNYPNLYLEHHKIIFDGAYGWRNMELIYTMLLSLGKSPLVISFSGIMSSLAALGIFLFTKKIYSKKVALFASIVFLTTPIVFAHSEGIAKVDLALTFFFISFLYLFQIWLKTRKLKWLVLSAFIFGIGVGIKYSLLLSLPAIILIILIQKTKKLDLKRKTITVFVFFVMIAVTILPWIQIYPLLSSFKARVDLKTLKFEEKNLQNSILIKEEINCCKEYLNIGNKYLKDIYGQKPGILDKIITPWKITMETNYKSKSDFWTNIGFLYLVFTPFFLLYLVLNKKRNQLAVYIAIITLSFIIFWIITANNVTWYAMPIFPLLAIMTAKSLDIFKKTDKHLYEISYLIIAVFILATIFIRLSFVGGNFSFLLQKNGEEKFLQKQKSTRGFNLSTTADYINNIMIPKEDSKIYTNYPPFGYFIYKNNEYIISDIFLKVFGCLRINYQEYSKIREVFKENRITYILFYKETQIKKNKQDLPAYITQYYKEYEIFQDFLKKEAIRIEIEDRGILYKLK
ncbi:hypothetical protein COY23_04180 [bacterium (Candidatus Torokbacteria) CG_4_10_14_0_2_um_filter_35_8]|nr:MAG: hypothetical protein COY23_04180 [bacterium (Candidatus Torokbacteria) CG_4_10_14_0_2_um_filter_35_8]